MRGCDHFERREFWIGAVDVVAADDDVFEALLLPFVAMYSASSLLRFDPATWGSAVKMRCWRRSSSGEGMDFEFFLDFGFAGGGGGGEAKDAGLRTNRTAGAKRENQRLPAASQVIMPCCRLYSAVFADAGWKDALETQRALRTSSGER